MKRIEYRVQWGGGGDYIEVVEARDLNTGLLKATRLAVANAKTQVREQSHRPARDFDLHSVEFWQVRS